MQTTHSRVLFGSRPWTTGVLLAILAALVSGCGQSDEACQEQISGCTVNDCISVHNECGGTVYECVDGEPREVGPCHRPPADAGVDAAPTACTVGTDPVPGCSSSACSEGVNACNGLVYDCVEGVVITSVCDPPPSDGGV